MKNNGNYFNIIGIMQGLFGDTGTEHGKYYLGFSVEGLGIQV